MYGTVAVNVLLARIEGNSDLTANPKGINGSWCWARHVTFDYFLNHIVQAGCIGTGGECSIVFACNNPNNTQSYIANKIDNLTALLMQPDALRQMIEQLSCLYFMVMGGDCEIITKGTEFSYADAVKHTPNSLWGL